MGAPPDALEARRAFWRLYSVCCEQADRALALGEGDGPWRDVGDRWRGIIWKEDRWRTSDVMRWGPDGVKDMARYVMRSLFQEDACAAVVGAMRKLAPGVDADSCQDVIKRTAYLSAVWCQRSGLKKQDPELATRAPSWPGDFGTRHAADALLTAAAGVCDRGYVYYSLWLALTPPPQPHDGSDGPINTTRKFLATALLLYRLNQVAPAVHSFSGMHSDTNFTLDFQEALAGLRRARAAHMPPGFWYDMKECRERAARNIIAGAVYAAMASPDSALGRGTLTRAKRRFEDMMGAR